MTAKAWLRCFVGLSRREQGEVLSQRGKNIRPGAMPIIGERGEVNALCDITTWAISQTARLSWLKRRLDSHFLISHKLETCFPLSDADLCIPNTGTFKTRNISRRKRTPEWRRALLRQVTDCTDTEVTEAGQDRAHTLHLQDCEAKFTRAPRTARHTDKRLACVRREFSNYLSGSSGSCLTVSNAQRSRGQTQPIRLQLYECV